MFSSSFSGGDVGPFKAIEESTLAHLLPTKDLHATLAWYYTLGSWGGALGLFSTGWLLQCLEHNHLSTLTAYRIVFWLYAAIGILKTLLTFLLSEMCEPNIKDAATPDGTEAASVDETESLLRDHRRVTKPAFSTSPETRRFLLKFCPILVFDNLGTGLATESWQTYFISQKFPSIQDGVLGSIFSTCSVIMSMSNILAIPVVGHIGILRTMILGHVLASTSLMLLPLPDKIGGAVMLLVIRAIFLDFDQAPRQTFLAQSVPSNERTAAMGVVNMTRTLAQSGGPILTGYLGQRGRLGLSFILAGLVKWIYDILLAVVFLSGNSKTT